MKRVCLKALIGLTNPHLSASDENKLAEMFRDTPGTTKTSLPQNGNHLNTSVDIVEVAPCGHPKYLLWDNFISEKTKTELFGTLPRSMFEGVNMNLSKQGSIIIWYRHNRQSGCNTEGRGPSRNYSSPSCVKMVEIWMQLCILTGQWAWTLILSELVFVYWSRLTKILWYLFQRILWSGSKTWVLTKKKTKKLSI